MNEYKPATKIAYSDYRVIIEPPGNAGWFSKEPADHATMLNRTQEIRRQVIKHLDNDVYAGAVTAFDREKQCAYCEYKWEWCVDEDGIPACCDEAVADYEAQMGEKA